MVFPELLAGVLACHALQDLGSAWVLVGECCSRGQSWSFPENGAHTRGGRDILVTSYTFVSTMIYMPAAASLCVATSAGVKDLDMIDAVLIACCATSG